MSAPPAVDRPRRTRVLRARVTDTAFEEFEKAAAEQGQSVSDALRTAAKLYLSTYRRNR